MTEELNNGVSLYTLKPKNVAVHTVNGSRKSNYDRRKIKIRNCIGVIKNYDSIVVPQIGREESETKDYVQLLVDLFQITKGHKAHEYSHNSRPKGSRKIVNQYQG